MPLVVPALRLFMLFLNVYETFKTLKIPPGSVRRGGKPSIRALTQRKRDLKGCLAIWVVWCCFAAYEKTFDGIIGLITPFYSEIKSVVILFLLLTRARGAEPLFLHVIRPLIKPYTATLDSLLDLARLIGDFLFALSQVPVDYTRAWWSSLSWHNDAPGSDEDMTTSGQTSRSSSNSSIDTSVNSRVVQPPDSSATSRRPAPVRSVSDNRRPTRAHQASGGSSARSTLRERRTQSVSVAADSNRDNVSSGETQVRSSRSSFGNASNRNIPEIWYPPASAYAEAHTEDRAPVENVEMPVPAVVLPATPPPPPFPIPDTAAPPPDDDWRTYPAFPSAYPPTPAPASASLPTHASVPAQNPEILAPVPRRPSETIQFPPIIEEVVSGAKPDFASSLQQPLEPSDPGSSDDASPSHGIQRQVEGEGRERPTRASDDDESEGTSEDSEDADAADEDEDDFDVTLRTPYHPPPSSESRVYNDSDEYYESEGIASSGSVGSLPSRSTALTTADNGSSLRTRTSSESTSSMFHTSDSSSVSMAGRKRSYPLIDVRSRAAAFNKVGTLAVAKNATIRRSLVGAPHRRGDGALTSEGDDEESDSSGEAKRRKVTGPAGVNARLRAAVRPASSGTIRRASVTARPPTAAVRGKAVATTQHTRVRTSSRIAISRAAAAVPRRGTVTSTRPSRNGDADTHSQDPKSLPRGKASKTKA